MKKRHLFFYWLLRPAVVLFVMVKFGYTYTKAARLPEQYIVISNHVTDYDMLLVAASFPRQMYFVGSEHIARWKVLGTLLRWAFGVIMRPKGTLGASTVKEILRTTKGGRNVCLFAEGARCWDGITRPFLPSTGKMVKSSRCGLVTYKLEGGYFCSPRWSGSNTRRGRLHGAPVRVYTAEELAAMSVEEINRAIANDLHEDAYARQKENPRRYRGKRLAEHMEDFLFVCPQCGEVDTMTSRDDTVSCAGCGLTFRYDEYGMLHGLPFDTVRELALWQREQVEKAAAAGVTYTAPHGTLLKVAKHRETPVDSGPVTLSPETLTCGDTVIPVADIVGLTMHGRRAIVFSTADTYYELLPSKGANVLKFEMLYEICKAGSPVSV